MQDDKQILLVAQKNAGQDDPTHEDIHEVGTIGTVPAGCSSCPTGRSRSWSRARRRARIVSFTDNEDFFQANAEMIEEEDQDSKEVEALSRSVISQFEQYIKLNKKIPPEVLVSLNQIEDSSKLADTVASHLALKISEKQELLETIATSDRLERAFGFMESEIGVLQVEKRIRNRVKRQMEKTQREYYLNEQLKAIQKELGESEDGRDEAGELEEKINETKLSKEAREKALQELKKMRSMSPMSAEATVVRNYLDWLLNIPWQKRSRVKRDLKLAQKGPRRGPLWARKGQGAHHRVPGRPTSGQEDQGADPVPRRTARCRQDLARQVDRAGDGAELLSACRSAACATRRKFAATGGPISARCPARSSRA